MEGDWAELLLLLLQHPSDRIFVTKIQGASSEKVQCETLLHLHIEAMMNEFGHCDKYVGFQGNRFKRVWSS